MKTRFIAVLLAFCGLAVTGAQAKPRTVADRVVVSGNTGIELQTIGPAVLAGITVPSGELGLAVGDTVEVKALPKDRHGRTPVILYKAGNQQAWQEHLLRLGRAFVYDRAATPKAWLNEEQGARHAKRGLWADPPLPAQQAANALGQFRFVEGTVTRTFKSRSMYYINFGDDWKTDFSLRIPRKAWRSFGQDFSVAPGTILRARGTVFLDNGPMIEITRPEQLEVLHADAQ